MILTKQIEIGINYKNIEHFKKLGYDVKCGKRIVVPIEHISSQSNIKVEVKCDYCGEIKIIKYQDYVINTDFGRRKYACKKCGIEKVKETNLERYGVEYAQQNEEIRNKTIKSVKERYGEDNISKTDLFKEKYKKTMNEKYGVDNCFQLDEIKEKSRQTMLDKYGVEYNMQRDDMKEQYLNGEKNNFWIDGRHELYESDWKSNKDADRIRGVVFKRDNRTCKICGSKEEINAHHLYSRNSHPDLVYDPDNIVTLCKKCHTDFHKEYGFGDNTLEQYNEFVKSKSEETIENTPINGGSE